MHIPVIHTLNGSIRWLEFVSLVCMGCSFVQQLPFILERWRVRWLFTFFGCSDIVFGWTWEGALSRMILILRCLYMQQSCGHASMHVDLLVGVW